MITIFSSWGYNARKWLSLSIRGVYFQIRRNIRQDVQIDIIISSTWLAQDSERATKSPYLAMPRMMTKVLVLRILFLFKMRSCYTFFPIKDTSFFTVVISSLGSMNHWGCCSKVSECTTTAVSISKKNFLAYFWEYNLSRRCFQIIYLQKTCLLRVDFGKEYGHSCIIYVQSLSSWKVSLSKSSWKSSTLRSTKLSLV